MNVRKYGTQGHGFGKGMDDYEEELRAFSRKREWEREREKHESRPSSSESGSEEEKSDGSGSHQKKKPMERTKKAKRSTRTKQTSLEDIDGNILCVQVYITMFLHVGPTWSSRILDLEVHGPFCCNIQY